MFPRWWCRAARCRSFNIQPDPAKMVQAGVTVPNILDAISRSNMIDSPGLIETNHQLVLTLMSGQARSIARYREYRHQDHAGRRAGAHQRRRHREQFGDARLHGRDGQRQAGGAAQYLPAAGQQHRGCSQRGAQRNRQSEERSSARRRHSAVLRSVGTGERVHQERARRHPARVGPRIAHHGSVLAGLGYVAWWRAW